MPAWTSGYVADVSYTFGYDPELNSLRIPFAFISEGFVPPRIETACELGFGQGLSINVHAAANPVAWYGTDFNPTQVAFARGLAAASGAELTLSDDSFAEYAQRSDLPMFDLITLHGVWSWVTPENRNILVDFIRRRLNVGGVVMISYNTMVGWAALMPVRELMVEHAAVMSAPGDGTLTRVDRALGFAERLMTLNPVFGRANPVVGERVKAMRERGGNYLAHEYFNTEWHATSFAEMSRDLSSAKLSYACTASHLDRIDGLQLTPEQMGLLSEIPDRGFRETVRDMLVNTSFRRDYWVRGAVRLQPSEQLAALDPILLMLVMPPEDVSYTVVGALGEARLNEALYRPLVALLGDHRPRSIRDIRLAPELAGFETGQIVQALTMLVGKHDVMPVHDDAVTLALRPQTSRLNAHVLDQARKHGSLTVLASPVTGTGVRLDRVTQLCVLAVTEGCETAEAVSRFVLSFTDASCTESDPVSEEVIALAQSFLTQRVPALRALGVLG